MSKQEEAGLILKLYELRREDTMRKARDWFFREFNPETMADYNTAIFGEHSGHLRMVMTYWEMSASLVNQGAISLEMFVEANGEQVGVFAKLEPLLPEIRATYMPTFLHNLEKLIDTMPEGRKLAAGNRERMKTIRAQFAEHQAKAAKQ
jgi:hypothetical protein